MNKIGLWFYLSCKRQLLRPFFLLLLLLLPAGMWLLHRTESQSDEKISIAIFTEGDEWNGRVAEQLMEEEHSFRFYLCKTKEELTKDVASKRAECGYIFSRGLHEKLDSGNFRRTITMVTSPSTVAAKLASETVFAGLFKVYARELLKSYSEKGEAFSDLYKMADSEEAVSVSEGVWKELEVLYDKYLNDGSTFSFEYASADGGAVETNSIKAVFPVRGIAAVFIFVMGLAAAVTTCEDMRRGLFMTVPARQKAACMMAQLSAPVAFACGSAFLCLLFTGTGEGFLRELSNLLFYGIFTSIFSFFMIHIIKNSLVIAGLIPFFIIGSLIACPIFADLSVFVPALGTLRRFLPPYYYLMM